MLAKNYKILALIEIKIPFHALVALDWLMSTKYPNSFLGSSTKYALQLKLKSHKKYLLYYKLKSHSMPRLVGLDWLMMLADNSRLSSLLETKIPLALIEIKIPFHALVALDWLMSTKYPNSFLGSSTKYAL